MDTVSVNIMRIVIGSVMPYMIIFKNFKSMTKSCQWGYLNLDKSKHFQPSPYEMDFQWLTNNFPADSDDQSYTTLRSSIVSV